MLRRGQCLRGCGPGPRRIERGRCVQSLDYRGLGRWGHIILTFMLLVISTWVMVGIFFLCSGVIALVVGFFNPFWALELMFRAGSIAFWMVVIGPIYGIIIGALGALSAKQSVIQSLRPKRVSRESPLWELTAHLAGKMKMPVPEVFIYENACVNAFATGCRAEDSAVIVSRGLLSKFDDDELAAVVAHELGHIASGDTWRMQFASSYQKSMVWYMDFAGARWLVRGTIALIGELAVLSLSRRREYWADAVAATLTSSDAIVRALKRIHGQSDGHISWKYRRTAFRWSSGGALLSSHPTCDQRVNAVRDGAFIRNVARKIGQPNSLRTMPVSVQVPVEPIEAWPTPKSVHIPDHAIRGPAPQHIRPPSVPPPLPNPTRRYAPPDPPSRAEWLLDQAFTAAPVLLLLTIGWGVVLFADRPTEVPVLVAEPKVVPRVAGWEHRPEPPATAQQTEDDTARRTRERLALLESKIQQQIEKVERQQYTKEARFEPDDRSGDGELTPYQMLVEQGTVCVYHANSKKEFIHQHMEDSGPDKSDLLVYLLEPAEPNRERRLYATKKNIQECWKKFGATPLSGQGAKEAYERWILKDSASGATAECGMWPMVRAAKKGRVAIAAYCR